MKITRYKFIKSLNKDYLIFFKKKDNYIDINNDKLDVMGVNYIILDNLKIIKRVNGNGCNKYCLIKRIRRVINKI